MNDNTINTIAMLNANLKKLDTAFDDEIFRLLSIRSETTVKSKEVLQLQLQRHYSTLVNFAENVPLVEPDPSVVDEMRQLIHNYFDAVEEHRRLVQSNAEAQTALDDSRSDFHERVQAIKKLVRY